MIGISWQLANTEPWADDAACRDIADPNIFHPDPRSSGLEAKAICRDCGVQQQCLEYALRKKIAWGVWGNHTEGQRRRMNPPVVRPDCGTPRGADRHYACRERLCEPCAEAVRQRSRNARAVRGASEGLKVVQGGVQARESGSHGGRADA